MTNGNNHGVPCELLSDGVGEVKRLMGIVIALVGMGAMRYAVKRQDIDPSVSPATRDVATSAESEEREAARGRQRMVDEQLRARDIEDPLVLRAMSKVPRQRFVPEARRPHAYADRPLRIGYRQTISQPYIVALMSQLAQPKRNSRVLDVGTGSGYQAAVLAELVEDVYSIEIVKPLAEEARRRLDSLGYQNIHVRHGDGYQGWKEQAPFDVIIVAAAPDHVPQALIEQLNSGGKLVIPVGGQFKQELLVIEKRADGTVRERTVAPVAFVPMTGEAQEKRHLDK